MIKHIRKLAFPVVLLSILIGACAGEEVKTYEGRGVYVGPAFNGEAIEINHEAIPGYMDAMEMSFKLRDPAVLQQLQPGDKVRFTLAVKGDDATVQEVEKLPADTELQLSTTPAPADTAASDTTGVDSVVVDTSTHTGH